MRNGKIDWRLLIYAGVFAVGMVAAPVGAALVPGRIAVSSDGNYHDLDDILASAVSIAILAKTGNAAKLVYYGYSDHFWKTDSGREERMRVSTVETANLFGGFDLGVFYNVAREKNAALAALVAEINKSSASDRLWLIGAGPMELIGQAVAQSNVSARPHVTLISHSNWNNTHAQDAKNANESGSSSITGWTFDELKNTGINYLQIQDQNGGLNEPYDEYYWLRDSSDRNLRWLWCRSRSTKCSEFSSFAAGAGKSTFDESDAGMAYFLVTGGTQDANADGTRDGDQSANPSKLRAMLEDSPPLPTTDVVRVNAAGSPYADSLGETWAADFGFNGGATTRSTADIAGTIDDVLYQTERFDNGAELPNLEYSFAMPSGTYQLDLHFAETYTGAQGVGKRVFDVVVEGSLVLDDLDIFSEVGGYAALVKSMPVSVTDGVLVIEFLPGVQNPKVNAIAVTPLSDGNPDADNDGLGADDDPCPDDPRNACAGPVATDLTGRSIRLNAGASRDCSGQRVDCSGGTWLADFGPNTGTAFSVTGALAGVSELFGCESQATTDLFLCERWDKGDLPELRYSFPVANGRYLVNLYFANTYSGTTVMGSRVFDVLAEDKLVLDDFDQVAAAGGDRRAVVRSVIVLVADETLDLEFRHEIENPAIKAIEVLSLP